jgi:heme-degrading monooxygenase HmoA
MITKTRIGLPAKDKEAQMFRTIIYLSPRNGDVQSVIDYFLGEDVLEHSAEVDGFISAELFQSTNGGPMMVTATWTSEDAYQRWIDHPWRIDSNTRINQVLEDRIESETRGDMYKLIHKVIK